MSLPKISVIVTTYNWPQALDRVLAALAQQHQAQMEVIVADDGSREETKAVVQKWQQQSPFPIKHCWQPDEGFRAAAIRNKAVAMAAYSYLVFIDGDCVPRRDFIQRHAALAESGWFVSGNRVLLKRNFTRQVLQKELPIFQWRVRQWIFAWLKGYSNRWMTLLPLPLGGVRKASPFRWQGVKTCNLAVWREDFVRVNGFDEDFKGWGYEDSDLVIRLLRLNIMRKKGNFGLSVFHLWHPEQDRSKLEKNQALLDQTLLGEHIQALAGVAQYLQESHDCTSTVQ